MLPRSSPAKWLAILAIPIASLAVLWYLLQTRRPQSVVPSHTYVLQPGALAGWKSIGGKWEVADGVIRNDSSFRGAKIVTGSELWRNYKLNADVRFVGPGADMGVMVRSSNEMEGVDTYDGYFIGFRTVDDTIVIGRSNFGWTEARPIPMPGGIRSSIWYRIAVVAYGCDIAASVQNLSTRQITWIAFEEHSCATAGRIGLRSLNPGGEWRNISIASATAADYLALRRNAGSIEHLQVPPGPPWWTPWHAGMLCGGILAITLLLQLAYFRMRQWKTFTINGERERLAHDIHDTMAQSFAGIGYQIQGIRHSLVRGDHVDSHHIADQLSVAYQLVRRCHEEASRTIAMLGSQAPAVQQNLLGALAETARKIASNQIRLAVKSSGNAESLNLRLADALLHIGREAIVNAVGHSDPTELKISLNFEWNSVRLLIEDNGRGFDYTPETAGFGIQGMQKRARDIGGEFQIVSAPGRGTCVRVTAWLDRDTIPYRFTARCARWLQTLRAIPTSPRIDPASSTENAERDSDAA
jgi:signal transduction histidine kinase